MNPITCEIDPSNRCQNNCNFCMYADYRQNNAMLELGAYEDLLEDLKAMGTKSITFTGGGEPLTNPDFDRMVLLAKDADFKIGLITNGILLDTIATADLFEFVRVSLDAATSETYRKIKGNGYFERVLDNIETFQTGISFVVCPDNEHEVDLAKQMYDFGKSKYIQFKPVYGTTLEREIEGAINTDRFPVQNSLPCHIAGLVGIVGADGSVWYCCQKRGNKHYLLGNIHEESFADIWADRVHVEPVTTQCKTCRYQNYIEEIYNPKPYVRNRWFM